MANKETKNFKTTAGVIFFLVAIGHLTIIASQSVLTLNGVQIEMWVSGLAAIVTMYMGLVAFDKA